MLYYDLYLRSAHSNAYFYGFWKNKRIVLFDTLLEEGIMPAKEKETATSLTEDKQQSGADGGRGEEGESDQQQSESEGGKGEEGENDQQQADLGSTKEEEQPLSTSEGGEGEGEKIEKKRKGCSKDEVLAVLAHELGHWKRSHNLINLSIGEVSHNDIYLLSDHTSSFNNNFRLIFSSLCSCLDSL